MSDSSTVYIYALCEPDTDRVRYIGKSDKPSRRFDEHVKRSKSDYPKDRWIRKIARTGRIPKLEILQECSPDNWSLAEIAWIDCARVVLSDLLNVAPGGENPPLLLGPRVSAVGAIFHNWTVLEHIDRSNQVVARCACGTVKPVSLSTLKNGQSKSCGCKKYSPAVQQARKKLRKPVESGARYGRLTVADREPEIRSTHLSYYCVCDCGNSLFVSASKLRTRHTKSCGCYRVDEARKKLPMAHEKRRRRAA